jgi:A/G-specific adenine glycosylase
MAAAVAAIAFGSRQPAADANVTRVLSRLFAIPGATGTRAHAAAVRRRAEALLARGRPGDVTAALMDFGQLVCLPRRPACPSCPLRRSCAARARDQVSRYPRRPARPDAVRVAVAAGVARRDRRLLLVRSDAALLRGMWLFPSAEGKSARTALARLRRVLRESGLALRGAGPIARARHTMVHRRLEIAIYRAAPAPSGEPASPRASPDVRWLTPAQLAAAAIPTLTRKIAAAASVLVAVPMRPRRSGRRS